jgi:solute carrier family 6 (neurotransmitter transporter, glycine) member 5/9
MFDIEYTTLCSNVFVFFIRDALVITTLDTFTSLLAGCTIFGILGNLAYETGVENVGQVVQSQTGLAFISYPDAIAKFERFPQVRKKPACP